MPGNFSALLSVKLLDELGARFGIPASAAYIARVAANLMGDPRGALTGPLCRGGTGTTAANLRALEGDRGEKLESLFPLTGRLRDSPEVLAYRVSTPPAEARTPGDWARRPLADSWRPGRRPLE